MGYFLNISTALDGTSCLNAQWYSSMWQEGYERLDVTTLINGCESILYLSAFANFPLACETHLND